ncbi:SusC/RagA family TonB-linked outer membrane protein [Pararcticibacter amylolyticus]|nr:TonB-dependent receptor [Pararcticibacter amylolyticus]
MEFYLQLPKDLLYIMRITLSQIIVLFILSGVSYAGSGRAQGVLNNTVRVDLASASLQEALHKIGKAANVRFVYSKDIIDTEQEVSLKAEGDKLVSVLNSLLYIRGIKYEVVNDQIVLSRMKKKEAVDIQQTLEAYFPQQPDHTVTGKVTTVTGETLPGVSIKIKGTQIGVVTNAAGMYTLHVPAAQENGTLVVIYLGFATQEISLGGRSKIDISLKEDVKALEEVVVIGYGTQKKPNVTGSIAKVTAEAIEERPINRVEQALQGQMAGVAVRSTSGSPGSDITINVRGAASIAGTATPLYVVDGVPLDNLSGINPNDIQSIDVLKDAASAAIYGSRGSNGVVLVTTKRGKTGKPVITTSFYTALSNPEKKLDVMTPQQWIEFNKKWYDRQWRINNPNENPNASQEQRIALLRSKTGRLYGTRDSLLSQRAAYGIYDPYWGTSALEPIDWQDAIFRTAPTRDLQVNASGATDNLSYSLSGGVFSQEGIIYGSSFDRYSVRANLDAKINSRLKVGFSLAPSVGLRDGANVDGKDNAVARSVSFPGWVPAGAGKMAGADPYKFYDGWGPGANNVSPYVQAEYNERYNRDTRLNTALNATLNIAKGLDVNGLLGWNYRGNRERTYSPTWINGNWNTATPGSLSSSRYQTTASNSLLTQLTASYNKSFGNHSIEGLLGMSEESFQQETSDQGKTGFPDDKSWVFTNTRGTTVNYNNIGFTENKLISYFGRLQYAFKDRYLLSASLRSDGSSKFGPDTHWGWFPAVSAGWKLHEESFLKDIDWLGTLKIRGSWGQAGNDRIGTSAFLSSMSALNYPYGDPQAIGNGFIVGNISNSLLRWEKTNSYNGGIDLGIFRDRIFMSFDFYYKKTVDLLLSTPVSLITGFPDMMDNVGNVENKGLEIELNSANLVGKFRWNTSFNLSLNRNKITSLGSNNNDIRIGQGGTIIQRVGSPINSYYLLKATGVLRESDFDKDAGGNWVAKVPVFSGQKPGDTKYLDVSGDGKINASDYVVAGSYQPDFEWGLTNSFSYRNFDLSVLLQGRAGGDLLSIGSRGWNRATNDPRWEYMEQWLTKAYWSEEEPGNGKVPAFFSAVTSEYDTNWLYDASYLRIKNITFGYNLKLKSKILSRARLYASIDNVYMWDNYYPGFSPEAASQDNASSDWGSYPQARTFSFGLNVTF